jgi:hypothetical protein
MTTPIRNAHGRFVKADNPLTVIGALQATLDRQRAQARLREQQDRRDAARKRGYMGPLTRADLITPDSQAGAW